MGHSRLPPGDISHNMLAIQQARTEACAFVVDEDCLEANFRFSLNTDCFGTRP